jgi:hypothetical protein
MNDRDILRALAGQTAEIASLPSQRETALLYRALNGLKPLRPAVLLDELPWNQLNAGGELTLQCADPFLRGVEDGLRKQLYKWNHCRADMLVEPHYILRRAIDIGEIGIEINEDIIAADRGNHIVAHKYHDQFDADILDKLHAPAISVDGALTESRRQQLDGIFGDLLPVKVIGLTDAGFFTPWDLIAMLRGAEPLLFALYDEPELMRAFMRKYTDIRLEMLKALEERGLLDAHMPVLHCTPGLTGELPGDIIGGRVTRANLWGRGAAQIFAVVSPEMHDEFDIQYQKEFFQGFGPVYYGCCEPLDKKIDIIRKLPNLRKISITPWADVRSAAEQMGGKYVLSDKPNPASVAANTLDEARLRADILETLEACRATDTPCEFILKDISSAAYNPNNLTRWAEVVRETVVNF